MRAKILPTDPGANLPPPPPHPSYIKNNTMSPSSLFQINQLILISNYMPFMNMHAGNASTNLPLLSTVSFAFLKKFASKKQQTTGL